MISDATQSETLTLTATDTSGAVCRYELQPENGVFVGTSSNCRFQLRGNGLSGIHCRIGLESGKLWVQDWMSGEGTRLNGQIISAKSEVQWGDVIQIGQHQIAVSTRHPTAKDSTRPANATEDSCLAESAAAASLALQSSSSCSSASSRSDVVSDDESPIDVHQSIDPVPAPPVSMVFEVDFDFDFEEEETFDRETVALLHAEIEDLQAALARRDAEPSHGHNEHHSNHGSASAEGSDKVLQRMQELIDEANRSDERVVILEELLHIAEDANRSEHEERHQLEAWVGDIENRVGQREEEHVAELEALRQRLEESNLQQERLQRQLQTAALSGNAPKHYEATLESLQQSNKQLQEKLAESQKRCLTLEQRLEQVSLEQERSLRAERANIAKEHAKLSRMRYEISSKLAEVEELPKAENQLDRETAHRIQTLRAHLREIHEQEKIEEQEASLASRLAKLWKRVEN